MYGFFFFPKMLKLHQHSTCTCIYKPNTRLQRIGIYPGSGQIQHCMCSYMYMYYITCMS